MSDTQTESKGEHAGGGKHRGRAAATDEPTIPAQGRHRRPAGESRSE